MGGSGITNICAEFSALLDGLGLARDFIALDLGDSVAGLLVVVQGDSELAINDAGPCRDPALAEVVERAHAIASELETRDCEVDFHLVRHALNPRADRLGNRYGR